MAWVLVTPSSRGIGSALTRHLLSTTPSSVPIVATTRASDPQSTRESLLEDLRTKNTNEDRDGDDILSDKNLARLDIQHCDLLSEESIRSLSTYCKDRYNSAPSGSSNKNQNPTHLRLAFMNPGMLQPEKSPQQIDYESALATLKLNLLSPMMLLKHFVPFLPRKSTKLSSVSGLPDSAVVACMSARVGSITDNGLGGWFSYRASKAGVNQLVKSTDLYVKVGSAGNACVVALHPGTVKTGLSKEFWANVKKDKLFEPEFAAEKLAGVVVEGVKGPGPEGAVSSGGGVDGFRGRCWDWKGEEVPP